jgi:signal transduction histidine kinase
MSRRVLAVVLAVTTLAVTAFFVPAAIAIRNQQQRQDLLELQREASIIATRVAAQGLRPDIVEPTDPDHSIGLYGPDARLIVGDGPAIADDPVVAKGIEGFITEGYVGDSLVAAVPVRLLDDGSAVVVRIEAPRSESRARTTRSLIGLGGAAIAVLAVAGGVAIRLSRRLNRPIDELRAWAESGEQRAESAPAPTGIREIDTLRDALVHSRARVDELLQRERSFSSQVSHQLRTPVAAMRVAIETELAAPRHDPHEVLRESVGQLDRLESTITSLLALARDTRRTPVECDVATWLRDRVSIWDAAAAAGGRTIAVAGAPGNVAIDADAVGHIIDVLIDNALRHGRGQVTVIATRVDGELHLDVADQGPTPTRTDAFADEGSDSSHGIGLRLARSLAESCHGTLSLLATPTTTFRLTLPT